MKFIPLILSLTLAFLATRSMFGNMWFPVHDATHIERVTLMHETIFVAKQFPPIWAENINNGYGYPLFHLYAPLFHLTATLVNLFTNGATTLALSLTVFMISAIGVYGMYQLTNHLGPVSSVVAATIYGLLPYAALNIYVRGAFAEHTALAILPWVFYSLRDLSTRRKGALAGLCLVLFATSHNLIPILAFIPILIWGYVHNRQFLPGFVLTLILALGLSSWYILPLLFERSFTQADTIARTTNYQLHFIQPWQIWNSTWGFGGSGPGVEDGMSFKLGKVTITLALVGFVLAIIKWQSKMLLIGLFALFSLFLTTSYSRVIWDNLIYLQVVQFPWRALGPLALYITLLAAYTLSTIPTKWLGTPLALIIIAATLFLSLKYFRPQTYEYNPLSIEQIVQVIPEYMPRWMVETPDIPASGIPLTLTGPAIITIDRAYYPTWKAQLDNNLVELKPSDSGLIELTVPSGTYSLKVWQSHTKLQYLAYAITLVTLGFTLGLLKERA